MWFVKAWFRGWLENKSLTRGIAFLFFFLFEITARFALEYYLIENNIAELVIDSALSEELVEIAASGG